jgi:hypothetical protein
LKPLGAISQKKLFLVPLADLMLLGITRGKSSMAGSRALMAAALRPNKKAAPPFIEKRPLAALQFI